MIGTWIQDIRFGLRVLRKNPEIALIAVPVMAIAIGATSTIFSVVNGLLIDPLPFRDSSRLVAIWQIDPRTPSAWRRTASGTFLDWRGLSKSFESVSAARNSSFTLTSFDDPETPLMRSVSHDYFETLGVEPFLGRGFRLDEDQPGGQPVLLLGYDLWQARFGGASNVLGRTTQIDGVPFEIIGVMPPSYDNPVFGLDIRPQVWLPLALDEGNPTRVGNGHLVVARLAEGITLEQAQKELAQISLILKEKYPETNERVAAHVVPLSESMVRRIRPAILLLFGAVVLVLLVACGNVGNLLLSRALGRSREIAVRRALGAGMKRLIRQLVVESLMLTLVAGGLGILLAAWGTSSLPLLLPEGPGLPDLNVGLDYSVVFFTIGLSVLTGLAFGLVPVAHAIRSNLEADLTTGAGRSTGSLQSSRLRGLLVSAEVALSLILLIGAGLMIRSFVAMQSLDPGFDPNNLLTFRVSTRGAEYSQGARRAEFFQRVVESVRTQPGVVSAGAGQALPFFAQFQSVPITLDALPEPAPGSEPRALIRRITPGYLEALQIPLRSGRAFNSHDDADAPQVVQISRTLAKMLWSGRDPLGERLTIAGDRSRGIIGIVEDVRSDSLPLDPQPIVYVPLAQDSSPTSMGYVVRAESKPLALLPSIRRSVSRVDRGMPVYQARPMEGVIELMDWRSSFIMSLLGIFAALALGLAATGIYAVLSYGVSQRTREIGIRMALGARRGDVVSMILRHGLVLATIGVLTGALGALVLSRLLEGQLYGVTSTDPLTYLGLSFLLAAIVLAAGLVPAQRATRVNPVLALRQD